MAKPWAALLCASSLAFGLSAPAAGREQRFLTPAQLEQPAQVAAWLREHGGRIDKKRAAIAHAEGVQSAARNSRGGAAKGFGESVIWFPSPQAFMAYADAVQRSLGPIREHNKDRAAHLDSDLRTFEALYRSALASDEVLGGFSVAEREQASANAACLAAYRLKRAGLATCAPLQVYGLRR